MEMEQWGLSSLKPDILFVNIIAQTPRDSLNTISKSVQYPVEEKFEHPYSFHPFFNARFDLHFNFLSPSPSSL